MPLHERKIDQAKNKDRTCNAEGISHELLKIVNIWN